MLPYQASLVRARSEAGHDAALHLQLLPSPPQAAATRCSWQEGAIPRPRSQLERAPTRREGRQKRMEGATWGVALVGAEWSRWALEVEVPLRTKLKFSEGTSGRRRKEKKYLGASGERIISSPRRGPSVLFSSLLS